MVRISLDMGLGKNNHTLCQGHLVFLAFPSPDSCLWLSQILLAISGTHPALGKGEGGHLAAFRQAVLVSAMTPPSALRAEPSPWLCGRLYCSPTGQVMLRTRRIRGLSELSMKAYTIRMTNNCLLT